MNAPVKFVGMPDGPKIFVKELGQEVGTFTTPPGGKSPALDYHVPLKMRGPYRAEQLANFSHEIAYRTDPFGYVLCGGFTNAGEKCSKRAENRSDRCIQHGGRLHPLDKLVKDDQEGSNKRETEALSRYQQFLAGQISVDDLDDEELATCGFRATNGRIYKPKNVPRKMVEEFTKAIYDRAKQELLANTVEAAHTMAEIMRNPKIEPDIRMKAAQSILDRNLGKAPQHVSIEAGSGWQDVFEGIFNGSREESRARRNIIDAEVVGERPIDTDSNQESIGSPSVGTSFTDNLPAHVEMVSDPTQGSDSAKDQRLFARNPAILAQTVEIKPFEYDLRDHSEEIKKATQRRYASRALGVDLDDHEAYILQESDDSTWIKVIDPQTMKLPKPQDNSATKARKAYTLSDFD